MERAKKIEDIKEEKISDDRMVGDDEIDVISPHEMIIRNAVVLGEKVDDFALGVGSVISVHQLKNNDIMDSDLRSGDLPYWREINTTINLEDLVWSLFGDIDKYGKGYSIPKIMFDYLKEKSAIPELENILKVFDAEENDKDSKQNSLGVRYMSGVITQFADYFVQTSHLMSKMIIEIDKTIVRVHTVTDQYVSDTSEPMYMKRIVELVTSLAICEKLLVSVRGIMRDWIENANGQPEYVYNGKLGKKTVYYPFLLSCGAWLKFYRRYVELLLGSQVANIENILDGGKLDKGEKKQNPYLQKMFTELKTKMGFMGGMGGNAANKSMMNDGFAVSNKFSNQGSNVLHGVNIIIQDLSSMIVDSEGADFLNVLYFIDEVIKTKDKEITKERGSKKRAVSAEIMRRRIISNMIFLFNGDNTGELMMKFQSPAFKAALSGSKDPIAIGNWSHLESFVEWLEGKRGTWDRKYTLVEAIDDLVPDIYDESVRGISKLLIEYAIPYRAVRLMPHDKSLKYAKDMTEGLATKMASFEKFAPESTDVPMFHRQTYPLVFQKYDELSSLYSSWVELRNSIEQYNEPDLVQTTYQRVEDLGMVKPFRNPRPLNSYNSSNGVFTIYSNVIENELLELKTDADLKRIGEVFKSEGLYLHSILSTNSEAFVLARAEADADGRELTFVDFQREYIQRASATLSTFYAQASPEYAGTLRKYVSKFGGNDVAQQYLLLGDALQTNDLRSRLSMFNKRLTEGTINQIKYNENMNKISALYTDTINDYDPKDQAKILAETAIQSSRYKEVTEAKKFQSRWNKENNAFTGFEDLEIAENNPTGTRTAGYKENNKLIAKAINKLYDRGKDDGRSKIIIPMDEVEEGCFALMWGPRYINGVFANLGPAFKGIKWGLFQVNNLELLQSNNINKGFNDWGDGFNEKSPLIVKKVFTNYYFKDSLYKHFFTRNTSDLRLNKVFMVSKDVPQYNWKYKAWMDASVNYANFLKYTNKHGKKSGTFLLFYVPPKLLKRGIFSTIADKVILYGFDDFERWRKYVVSQVQLKKQNYRVVKERERIGSNKLTRFITHDTRMINTIADSFALPNRYRDKGKPNYYNNNLNIARDDDDGMEVENDGPGDGNTGQQGTGGRGTGTGEGGAVVENQNVQP